MKDIFEPRREPAKSIYLAFQSEAAKRQCRSIEERLIAERDAVFRECRHQATLRGLLPPTEADVADAQRYAYGAIDYGATWIYQIVRKMTPVAQHA